MVEVLILVVLVVMVVVVLLLPIWTSRRKRQISDSLARYQAITEALLESDLPRAREALKSLIRTNTEDIAAYLRLARILRKEGDLERSVALYRSLKARDIHERSLRQQILAGLVEDLFLLGRYDEARAEVDGLKQLDRKSPLIWQVEVHEALAREDWSRAVKAAESLSRTGRGYAGPTQAQIRTYVASKRADAGEVRDARKLLEEALKDEPDYGPALALLGDLWSRHDDHEKAASVWKQLLRARPGAAPHVLGKLEKAYFEMGRFSELDSLYEELSGSDRERSSALQLGKARMALRRGDTTEALRIVQELLQREPQCREVQTWHLLLLIEAGRAEDARDQLKKAADAMLASPERRLCPYCGHHGNADAVRCEQCGKWFPDPFITGDLSAEGVRT